MEKPIDQLPTFFLLGAAKAGTTSLFSYMEQHPDIFFSAIKEPHFFDDPTLYRLGLDWYLHEFFSQSDMFTCRGEATPMLHLPHIVCERIKQAYQERSNDLRFIVVLRNPVDRAWSHYLHTWRTVMETENFENALKLEDARLEKNPNDWVGYFRDGLYAEQMKVWFQYFAPKQFLFVLQDELNNQPQTVLQKVFEFLNVSTDVHIDTTYRTNTASQPKNRYLMRLVSSPPKFVQFFTQSLLPRRTRKIARAYLRKLLSKPYDEKPELDLKLARSLATLYQSDIEQLELILQRDLGKWKSKYLMQPGSK